MESRETREKMMEKTLSHKSELDSKGDVAEIHVDIVKELLLVDGETSLIKNLDGMTALHVAAIKGQGLVLRELVTVQPELVQVLTNRGETALHLSVKLNHVEAVKVLAEEMMKKDNELLNKKNCEGNTVLHIAVSNKHLEIVNYILTLDGVQVNALNSNELTALDLLTQSPQDLKGVELECAVRVAGASSVDDLHLEKNESVAKTPYLVDKHIDWLCTLLVVVSLIGTVMFHVGVSLSGIWLDKCILDEAGLSLSDFHWQEADGPDFEGSCLLVVLDAFFLSMFALVTCVAISQLPVKRRWWMAPQLVIMWLAVSFQVGLYLVTLRHMTRQCQSHFPSLN